MYTNKKLTNLFIPNLTITFYILSLEITKDLWPGDLQYDKHLHIRHAENHDRHRKIHHMSCNELKSRYPIQMALWSVVRWKLIFGTEEMLLVRKRLLLSVTYFPSYNISFYSKSFTLRITGISINQISWFIEKKWQQVSR